MKQFRQVRVAILLLVALAVVLPALALPHTMHATVGPSTVAGNEVVSVWLTDLAGNARLTQQANLSFAPDSGFNPVTIGIDEHTQFQQMEGFGSSFTDSSAWLVYNELSAMQETR